MLIYRLDPHTLHPKAGIAGLIPAVPVSRPQIFVRNGCADGQIVLISGIVSNRSSAFDDANLACVFPAGPTDVRFQEHPVVLSVAERKQTED